jgi:hypothetical protein
MLSRGVPIKGDLFSHNSRKTETEIEFRTILGNIILTTKEMQIKYGKNNRNWSSYSR